MDIFHRLYLFLTLLWTWASCYGAGEDSLTCKECIPHNCPVLTFCWGQVIKDECNCCSRCSSDLFQPHARPKPKPIVQKKVCGCNQQLPSTSSTPPAVTTPPPASSPAALAACSTPAENELQCGWTGKSDCLPRPHIKDIDNYLLHSSHNTEDSGKMQCYRQYIRGLNFYKEGYIHKVMYNAISDESALCYVRSKCYPSMKKGVYGQWLLLSKREPFRVEKAGCTCPAGCGEGCTHVAGLLFALKGRPVKGAADDMEDLPCTSKPCQWNRPNKRKKETRPIQDISFKRIKYENKLKEKKKKVASYKVDNDSFRNTLCGKLGNSSRGAFLYSSTLT
ncbi:hypothetical protein ACJMK2_037274 [Sinanodonta woodiana]|uniref:SWIM-type domain-containing protein n=1 Tax=Sinanodonta woodiana TaxID=1069815 RepID=A0ABD3WJS4_SINWO